MQSTLNTATAPIRPKIGRPPAAMFLPPLAVVEAAAPEVKPVSDRSNLRVLGLAVALVLAMTLVLGRALAPVAPPIPPLVETAPAPTVTALNTPMLVGTLTPIGPTEPALSYRAEARKAPIDNNTRERLRSILSKD